MMNKILAFSIVLGLCTFLLSACGPVYKTTDTYEPPDAWSGRKCINRCLKVKSQCSIACKRTNQTCIAEAREEGSYRYRQYARRRRKAGKKVVLGPNDFIDTSACHSGCSCAHDYRECYMNCGGKVITHRRCVAFCPKPKPNYRVQKSSAKKKK